MKMWNENKRQLGNNLLSSISGVVSKASNSMNPRIKEAGITMQGLLAELGDRPTEKQLENVVKMTHKVVSAAASEGLVEFKNDYDLVLQTASDYNSYESDEVYTGEVNKDFKSLQTSSERGQVVDRVVNPTTGKVYYREGDKMIPEEEYESYVSKQADMEFVANKGVAPEEDLYSELVDK